MTLVRRLLSNRKAVVMAVVALTVVALLPVTTLVTTHTPPVSGMVGNATHFERLPAPLGGCGVPEEELDAEDFVSLNVFHTPDDYGSYPRPLPSPLADKVGRWDNGRNCGRFVQVTLGDRCSGTNDGATGKPFCRNGFWTRDGFNGATLTMVVADGCADPSAWCRDDRDHLGLSRASLKRFVKDGGPVSGLDPEYWNNRQVSWSYVPAPNYRGDLRFGFLKGSHRFWPVISVSHLPNGIHGVEYLSSAGTWKQAQPNGDMGQSFVIGSTTGVGTTYQVRVRDAADALVNNGRVYTFSLPAQCAPKCPATYAEVDYSTDGSTATSSSSATTTTTTEPPEPPAPPTTVVPVTTTPPTTTTTTPPRLPSLACAVSAVVTNSWPNGFQLEVTVTNTGTSPLSGWSTALAFAGSQRINNAWNALLKQSGREVVADNQSYNGTLAAGASTSWGAIMSGVDQPPSGLRCTGR